MRSSTLKLTLIAASLLLLHTVSLLSQQRQSSSGSIQGIIVRAGTNEPIAGAHVTLSRGDIGTTPIGPATTTTDPGGVFVFRDVPAGSFHLEAARNGYVRQEYGQRAFNAPGTVIHVGPGQVLKDLAIYLIPSGSIEGRVTDVSRNPAVGIPVELLRKTYDEHGQRKLELSGSTTTNDRGEYRLFGITPGRYYVNAGSAKGSIGRARTSGNSANEVGEEYEPAYYPGVADVSQAAVIEVRASDQVNAIDIMVNPQRLFRIRGRIVDASSRGVPATANISITYLSPTGLGNTLYTDATETYNRASGTFELRDVAPGPYVVGAAVPEQTLDARQGSAEMVVQPTVLAPVTVTDSDVENVQLTVMPAATLTGKLRVEGQTLTAVPGIGSVRVELKASLNGSVLQDLRASEPQFKWVSADGTFALVHASPGEYLVRVAQLPPDYYVKQIRFSQSDVFNEPLHFSGAAGPFDVVISPNGGRIDGTAVNAKQEPVRGVEVILIPDRQRDRADLYKTASTDEMGHFSIRGIPPGDYKVFSWEALEEFAYYDPDLVRSYEQRGVPVRIVESAKESLDVKIIPAGQ